MIGHVPQDIRIEVQRFDPSDEAFVEQRPEHPRMAEDRVWVEGTDLVVLLDMISARSPVAHEHLYHVQAPWLGHACATGGQGTVDDDLTGKK
jgi:hypothetical protein